MTPFWRPNHGSTRTFRNSRGTGRAPSHRRILGSQHRARPRRDRLSRSLPRIRSFDAKRRPLPLPATKVHRPWRVKLESRRAGSAPSTAVTLRDLRLEFGGEAASVVRAAGRGLMTSPGRPNASTTSPRTSSRIWSASHTAFRSRRCICCGRRCPACSASHQQFLRSMPDNRPAKKARAVRRGSTRVNRPAIRASPRRTPLASRQPLRCGRGHHQI